VKVDEWLDMRLNRGSEKTQLNSASLQLFTNAYAFKKAAGYGSRTSFRHAIPREETRDRHQQNNTGVAGLFCHSLRW
jgi:hypothetical protein